MLPQLTPIVSQSTIFKYLSYLIFIFTLKEYNSKTPNLPDLPHLLGLKIYVNRLEKPFYFQKVFQAAFSLYNFWRAFWGSIFYTNKLDLKVEMKKLCSLFPQVP